MAITSITEIGPTTASINLQRERTYVRTFRVETDSLETGPGFVRNNVGIIPGDHYVYGTEIDTGAFCNDISIDRESEDGLSWIVTVSYGPLPPQGEIMANPLLQPPDISFSHREFERHVERDQFGNPITNSAGDVFNPTVVRDDSRLILQIVRNEATAPTSVMNQIKNSVNATEFTIPGIGTFPPRTLKAMAPQAAIQWHQNVENFAYWKVTYQFEFNDDVVYESDDETVLAQGWDTVLLDVGYRYLEPDPDDPANNPPTRKMILVDDQPAQDPVPLDGSGKVLPTDAEAKYLAYRVYPEVDHATILGFV